jgi:hypothetical protein
LNIEQAGPCLDVNKRKKNYGQAGGAIAAGLAMSAHGQFITVRLT